MGNTHTTEDWIQLHINKFPASLKNTMETWGVAQMPDWTLRQVVITACQEWVDRNVKHTPDEQKRQARIEKLEQEIADLKRGG